MLFWTYNLQYLWLVHYEGKKKLLYKCKRTSFKDHYVSLSFQEHRDLEARIAQIIKSTEEKTYEPVAQPPPHRNKYAFQTRPYNEDDGEEAVMDDEELHSLLGV